MCMYSVHVNIKYMYMYKLVLVAHHEEGTTCTCTVRTCSRHYLGLFLGGCPCLWQQMRLELNSTFVAPDDIIEHEILVL